MDTDLQLQGSRGSVRLPCDKALSKAHSLNAERFTGNDILTQIYPQMYTLYKTTFKFFQLTMNVTFKTVIYALKKTSVSHPLLLLSGNTLERLEKSICLRTFYSSRWWAKHAVFLSGGNTDTFNQTFEKLLPRALQMGSGWSLLLKKAKQGDACHQRLGWDSSYHLQTLRNSQSLRACDGYSALTSKDYSLALHILPSQKINFKFQLQMQLLWGNDNQQNSSLLSRSSIVRQVLGIHTVLSEVFLFPIPETRLPLWNS